MLHIVNKAPLEKNSLATALRYATSGALLLIEDGVYAATRGNAAEGQLRAAMGRPNGLKVYALALDLQARGMGDRVIEGVLTIGYDGFVDLVAEYRTNQSWL